MSQGNKGIIHLLPLILIVLGASLGLLAFMLLGKSGVKSPFSPKEPQIELKTEYKNPFDKKAQYVNPFDQYKSPFHNLR